MAALSAVFAAELPAALLLLRGSAMRRARVLSWIAFTVLTDCAITKVSPGATNAAPLPHDGPAVCWWSVHDDLNRLRRRTCCDD